MPHAPRPDRRRNAWRDDLAAESLRGIVEAARYVTGEPGQVIAPVVALRAAPRDDAGVDTEALFGARLRVYERREGWAWVQLDRDGYVGYVREAALSATVVAPTHRIVSLGTHMFPAADLKTPPVQRLPLGAEVAVTAIESGYARLAGFGFLPAQHIAPVTEHAADFVAVAERLIGTPYLWGGRSALGIDCSGLVQLAMEMAGLACPRDSDMQAAEVGDALSADPGHAGLQRGDLVCWKGHIGIMRDGTTLLHANAHHMAVASEPLTEAMARIAGTGVAPPAFRRPRR